MQDRADKRKYHFIYKTTNIITNKFYIGMHSTNNLEDGYIGSGKRLWHSINKYGKENHKCEILEFVNDRKTLSKREAEIVNEEFLLDPLCLNLKTGGENPNQGFHNAETRKKISASNSGKVRTKEMKEKISLSMKGRPLSALHLTNIRNKPKPSEETRLKMSQSRMGRVVTEETRQKISKAHIGRVVTEETKLKLSQKLKGQQTWLGKHHTEESKQKISKATIGKPKQMTAQWIENINKAKYKKVIIDGILFNSVGEAISNTEFSKRAIYKKLKDEKDINSYYVNGSE